MTSALKPFLFGLALAALAMLGAGEGSAQPAAPAAEETLVTVTGESAHSFEEAKEDALRRAVEVGAGKEVFGDTRVADFTLRHDVIISRAAGYVRTYDVLERKMVDGIYTVRVQATVVIGKIRDDWGAIQVLLERKGRPNILVLVTEEGQGLTWTGNAAEYKLRELFGEKGFKIVDDEALANVIGRDMTRAALAGDVKKAAAAANQLHAGYVVLGRALVRAGTAEDVYGARLTPVSADLLLKIVATDSAQQLVSKTSSAKRASEDPTSAAKQALDLAAKEIWPELLRGILNEWSLDLDMGATMTVLGTRVPTDVLDAIVAGLRKTEKVKTVTIVDHNEQMSTLSVMTRLESRELGKILKELSGGKVEVTGISPGRVEFRLAVDKPAVLPPEPLRAPLLTGVPITVRGMLIPAATVATLVEGLRTTDKVTSAAIVDQNNQMASLSVATSLEPTELGEVMVKLSGGQVRVIAVLPGRVEIEMVPGKAPPPPPPPVMPPWVLPAGLAAAVALLGLVGGFVLIRRRRKLKSPAPQAGTTVPSVSGLAPTADAAIALRPTADTAIALRPAAGDRVDGFDILEKVGEGGMGAVYRAYERALRREVALKTILPEVAADPSLLKRFRHEAVLAGNLSHPNIVPVYHIDDRPTPRYFTMEFVRGPSLRDKVDRDGPMDPAVATRIALEVADALQCAHEHQVIHRDIKPRNILIEDRSGRARVTDFGIARDISGRLAEKTRTEGRTAGTPAFMSPEQARGEDLDARTDIFSLGATFYYMLTGRTPYEAEDRTGYLAAFQGAPPPLPSRLNAKVGPALDAAVMRMLAVDREKRYRACAEVVVDLKQI